MDQNRLLTGCKIFCISRRSHVEKSRVFKQRDHKTYNPSVLYHSPKSNTNEILLRVYYVYGERKAQNKHNQKFGEYYSLDSYHTIAHMVYGSLK